jgi:serine-type D-Ala-D-Ala carboxypeptidase (penicillin-binding protein 5/6)
MNENPHDTPLEQTVLAPHEPFVAPAASGSFISEHAIALMGAGAVVSLVLMTGVRSWGAWYQSTPVPTTAAVAMPLAVATTTHPSEKNPFEGIALGARAAVVYDVYENKVIYAHNGDKVLPLASLTKLMTSLIAMETLDQNSKVAISQNSIDTEGDSGLLANEEWRLKDLVSFTMLTSSNDGADALAAAVGALSVTTPPPPPPSAVGTGTASTTTYVSNEYLKVDSFVKRMNRRADELGLSTMQFNNPTGLDEPNGEQGGVGTAKEMAKLFTYAWNHAPSTIEHTDELRRTFTSSDGYQHVGENTNEQVRQIPGIIGSKTGYTDMAGGNLAVLYNAGLDHPIVVVVLGSTKEGRFNDVEKLIDTTYQYVETGWYQFEVAGSTDRG